MATRKANLNVVQKYIVNYGEPNQMLLDEVHEAFWVASELLGFHHEYHIANWQGKYGIIDFTGKIVVPFEYDWFLMGMNDIEKDSQLFVAMYKRQPDSAEVSETVVYETQHWNVVFRDSEKVVFALHKSRDGKQYLAGSRSSGRRYGKILYDMDFNEIIDVPYTSGFGNELSHMYSVVSLDGTNQQMVIMADGDHFLLNPNLTMDREIPIDCNDSYFLENAHGIKYILRLERHGFFEKGGKLEHRNCENAFYGQWEVWDPHSISNWSITNFIMVFVPKDAKHGNYQIEKCIVRNHFNNAIAQKEAIEELEQYIIY